MTAKFEIHQQREGIEWPTANNRVVVLNGDARALIRAIPDNSVQCAVTSPPYWGVRDYGVADQIGAEPVLTAYIKSLVLSWMYSARCEGYLHKMEPSG